ncbi:MAG: hypothetical protein GQ574_04125 [Crocinitomix sp.]|nr:hypothetical protein [Crocinitomix sp.]
MNRNLQSQNKVSVCHKDNCVHATGKNADKIANAATGFIVFAGLTLLIKAIAR